MHFLDSQPFWKRLLQGLWDQKYQAKLEEGMGNARPKTGIKWKCKYRRMRPMVTAPAVLLGHWHPTWCTQVFRRFHAGACKHPRQRTCRCHIGQIPHSKAQQLRKPVKKAVKKACPCTQHTTLSASLLCLALTCEWIGKNSQKIEESSTCRTETTPPNTHEQGNFKKSRKQHSMQRGKQKLPLIFLEKYYKIGKT